MNILKISFVRFECVNANKRQKIQTQVCQHNDSKKNTPNKKNVIFQTHPEKIISIKYFLFLLYVQVRERGKSIINKT